MFPRRTQAAHLRTHLKIAKKAFATVVSPIDQTPQSRMATGSGGVLAVPILGGGEGALPDACCCVCKDFSGKKWFQVKDKHTG
jgi:hypothetical protein